MPERIAVPAPPREEVAGTEPLLRTEDLTVRIDTPRGPLVAVDGVSMDLSPGEALGIVGESGSGKTVLAKSVLGLHRGAEITITGRVFLDGTELTGMPEKQLRRLLGADVSMVLQDPMTSLNPVLTVGSQVAEPLRLHRSISKAEARAKAIEMLDMVGISEPERRFGQYPHQLSGGMRQRVMIASALVCDPRLLIADEPTTALDVTVQAQILDKLDELRRGFRMAMLLITHDMGVVSGRTDRTMVMYAGEAVELAPTKRLFAGMRHPYTRALVDSVPSLDKPTHARIPTIPGSPPVLTDPPPGCRFAPRCALAQPGCHEQRPVLREIGPGHHVRCHHPLPPVGGQDGKEVV